MSSTITRVLLQTVSTNQKRILRLIKVGYDKLSIKDFINGLLFTTLSNAAISNNMKKFFMLDQGTGNILQYAVDEEGGDFYTLVNTIPPIKEVNSSLIDFHDVIDCDDSGKVIAFTHSYHRNDSLMMVVNVGNLTRESIHRLLPGVGFNAKGKVIASDVCCSSDGDYVMGLFLKKIEDNYTLDLIGYNNTLREADMVIEELVTHFYKELNDAFSKVLFLINENNEEYVSVRLGFSLEKGLVIVGVNVEGSLSGLAIFKHDEGSLLLQNLYTKDATDEWLLFGYEFNYFESSDNIFIEHGGTDYRYIVKEQPNGKIGIEQSYDCEEVPELF